jgi:RNA polymerase sigma-70 factor (ECF subfamily)
MDPTTKTDAELVADTLSGDHAAFGTLYDRHSRYVRAVVAAVSCDWSAVDDMTQECFLRAYRKLDSLRDRNRVGPWLAGFARQVARERRRTLRRDRHEFGSIADDAAASNCDPSETDRDRIEQIMRRLAELPEDERLAVHAYYFTDQNSTAAAAQLKLSRSGFYARLQRALANLATRPQPVISPRKRMN